ncbi:NADPH:quinone reductase [Blastopirellula marina]|uniref:Quinone oxidoreductase n=1 Tax=Blastopirellula marina TaxID=124 RepID=A0A2S8FHT5_9BACT|nr:NADPH:quinone reductase [Blastopirellula marina]PQO31630.1 quinone oxidoreductase [Blastopirellula marina]PTL42937.1 NADPH:quinone reductase [Blastopirellula marina]
MKAAYFEETGPPEVIQYGDLPTPEPGEGQVLVKVGAAALNPIDTYIRNGANYWELPKPFVTGSDLAGTIEAVGHGTKKFMVGQRVWGTNQGLVGRQGTFAEYAVVDEHWLYATPDNVTDEAAAACALTGVTAHIGLGADNARLKPGETIFVHGGSGGVGSMVVQMAKAIGATVLTTAGSDEKAELCKELGADHIFNYKTQNVAEELLAICPGGVNVIWETVREPDFDFLVSIAAERCRMVLMAGRDARPPFPVGPFYVKECSLHGFVMFKATPEEMAVCGEDISRWLAEGKLKPRIGKEFPLSEAAAAHQLQEDNTLRQAGTLAGKIVVKP